MSVVGTLVELRKSSIQGKGVFAMVDIPKGRRILEYLGERISHGEANRRSSDDPSSRHHTFLFTLNDRVVLDASRSGNEARFINHSCDPNCEAILDRGHIYIYAKRNIRAGSELFYDYKYTTDDNYTVEDLKKLYPCRCGTKRCRGTIASLKGRLRSDRVDRARP